MFVSDSGIDFTQKATKTIKVEIIDRADVFPVTFTGTLSGTAENDASDTSKGITLIATSNGTYSGITSGGKAVTTSNFDGWIIGIKNPDTTLTDGKYDAFPKSYNEIMLKVGNELFNAKTSANNAELVFNIPSSNLYVGGTDYPIKLITPEYFDSSLDLTFKTLSQGGAGDVAISSAIDRAVPIYSVADGVKTLEDPGNIVGVEDGAAIRLSVKVAREDTSENITQVKLTGLNADFGISRNTDTPNDTSNVVYLTRVDGQLIENTFNADYISRSVSGENVEYVIDIQGQAKALVDANSQIENTNANYQQTEDFLARNLGIKTSKDISGEKDLTFSITTIDRDNPNSVISNIKTQSVELKINVKNINDLAFIDETTISSDSTYFENPNLPFLLHKDAIIRDKEANNFFGGVLTVLIANIAGAALASERITLAKDSLFSLDDLQLKLNDEIIGSITKNDNSGLTIEFNEYQKL